MENNKRTSLISVLIILLCLSLCVGATYAYFTDSVTSSGNKIQAGNLKIDLELLDKEAGVWNSIKTSQAPIFNYTLWEPGYTDVKYIKIVNNGSLALNYDLSIEAQGAVGKLAEVINVYYAVNDDKLNLRSDLDQLSAIGLLSNVMNGGSQASGTLLPEGTTDVMFECAVFDRTAIRLTGRAHGMRTEASGRFEKGLDCELEVDGGVDPNTAPICIQSGANVLVAGSSVMGQPDLKSAAEDVLSCAKEALV